MAIFGYDTTGTYGLYDCRENILGFQDAPAGSGTVDMITVRLAAPYSSGTIYVKCCLYDASGNYIANSVTDERTFANTIAEDWYDFTYSGAKPSVTASTPYIIAVWGHRSSGTTAVNVRADNDYGSSAGKTAAEAYNGFPASVSFSNTTRLYCIYATYTPSGGGVSIPVMMNQYNTHINKKIRGG